MVPAWFAVFSHVATTHLTQAWSGLIGSMRIKGSRSSRPGWAMVPCSGANPNLAPTPFWC